MAATEPPDDRNLAFATLDFDRAERAGFPGEMYCPGKTGEQIASFAAAI